jgi:hypothetical protein
MVGLPLRSQVTGLNCRQAILIVECAEISLHLIPQIDEWAGKKF